MTCSSFEEPRVGLETSECPFQPKPFYHFKSNSNSHIRSTGQAGCKEPVLSPAGPTNLKKIAHSTHAPQVQLFLQHPSYVVCPWQLFTCQEPVPQDSPLPNPG